MQATKVDYHLQKSALYGYLGFTTNFIIIISKSSNFFGRPGTADEVANVAELLMRPQGAFITGADFLIDGRYGIVLLWPFTP